MSRGTIRTIAWAAMIAIGIWAIYNPQLADAKFNELMLAVCAKASFVIPIIILLLAKDILRGLINTIVTVIVLFIALRFLISCGVIPMIF